MSALVTSSKLDGRRQAVTERFLDRKISGLMAFEPSRLSRLASRTRRGESACQQQPATTPQRVHEAIVLRTVSRVKTRLAQIVAHTTHECANYVDMDYEKLAADWLRSIRGKRSQRAFSRRLGYRSNIAHRWESARCFPTAAEVFRMCVRSGIDPKRAIAAFYGQRPAWLERVVPASPEAVAALLRDLRGKTTILELARRSGHSRFSLSRWLRGRAEPRLPELLSVIEAATFRVLDFLSHFTDVAKLPSAAAEWRALQAARKAAYDVPWSHAVLRALELADYAALPRHRLGWIAGRLGISRKEEVRCLQILHAARQIRFEQAHWVVDRARNVDTRADPARSRAMKAQWLRVALERLENGMTGTFGYNVMAMSRSDFEKLKELHLAYFRNMQALVADSTKSECVVRFNTQLFALDPGLD